MRHMCVHASVCLCTLSSLLLRSGVLIERSEDAAHVDMHDMRVSMRADICVCVC